MTKYAVQSIASKRFMVTAEIDGKSIVTFTPDEPQATAYETMSEAIMAGIELLGDGHKGWEAVAVER